MKQCMENATKLCPDYPEKCTKCGAFREPTNADRIRETDRALAEKLTDCTYWFDFPYGPPTWADPYGNSYLTREDAVNEWVEWLQQPAEDNDE